MLTMLFKVVEQKMHLQLRQLHSRYAKFNPAKYFRLLHFVVLNRQIAYPAALNLSPCWWSSTKKVKNEL